MARAVLPTHTGVSVEGKDAELLDKARAASPFVSGLAYCSVSAAMVLLNKHALSSFSFACPNTLLLAQCMSSVLIVKGAEMVGVWKVEPLRWDIVKVCLFKFPWHVGICSTTSLT
jgi:hypothetical protein